MSGRRIVNLVAVVAMAATSVPAGLTATSFTGEAAWAGSRKTRLVAIDVAPRAGIATTAVKTWSATVFDHDVDGDEDVLIGYHAVKKLWSNQGDGTYVQVAHETWPANSDRHGCDWADVDLNGLPDVYCATGRGRKNYVKGAENDNDLSLQLTPGTFTDVGTEWGVGDPCGRGREVAFVDANGDPYPDLFVGNVLPRAREDACDDTSQYSSEESKILVNQAGLRFVDSPAFATFGGGQGNRCVIPLDFDGDGWEDLFTCRGWETSPRLYRNVRGTGYINVTGRHRLGGRISDADAADIDGDGDLDLATAFPRGFAYHVNRNGRFGGRNVMWRPKRGSGAAVAWGDADADGDLDLYAMVGNGAKGNPADRILLDRGSSFRPIGVPRATGAADDVVTLNRHGKGRSEFLALNGHNLQGEGPVQLIRLVRR